MVAVRSGHKVGSDAVEFFRKETSTAGILQKIDTKTAQDGQFITGDRKHLPFTAGDDLKTTVRNGFGVCSCCCQRKNPDTADLFLA